MNVSPTSLMGLFSTTASAGSPREERLAAAAEAKARDAKAAFETLKQRRSDVSEDRKAIARQKIEQLKARLQALRAMASVDPQGTARLAAKLARELGAAVKAYAAAGGMVAGASPAVTVPTSGSAAAGAEAGIGTEAGAGNAAPAVAGEASAATDQTKADGETGGDEAGKQANPYQQAIEEQKAQAQEMVRRSAEKQADTDFMAEVRKLAAELKALVRQAVEKTPGDNDALNPAEARAMKAAIEAMDREVEQAGADLGGSLSLLV
jgi:hypothetical protein